VLSVVVCVGLAWWQWQRFENGGTWQNLGYVLQWPLFGLFPAFMFWRLHKLRVQERATAADQALPAHAAIDAPNASAGGPNAPVDAPDASANAPDASANAPDASANAPDASADGPDASADGPDAPAGLPEVLTGASAPDAAAHASTAPATQLVPERAGSHQPPPRGPDKTDVRQDDHDEDPELAAYNRYLAQLNARHQQETR
jgi:hypothetical protein